MDEVGIKQLKSLMLTDENSSLRETTEQRGRGKGIPNHGCLLPPLVLIPWRERTIKLVGVEEKMFESQGLN